MRIGINEYPLSCKIGFKEACRFLHELGFETIDLNFYDRNELFDNDNWQGIADEIKTICKENQLIISQMHANWFRSDDSEEVKEYKIKMNKRAIEVCGYLECPFLVMHAIKFTGYYSSDIIKAEANNYNLALFKDYRIIAKQFHVQIALENMFGYVTNTTIPAETIFTTAQQINEYIDILGPHFVACLDSGHAYVAQQKIKEMVIELGDNLKVLHIHDAVATDDSHLVPYLGHIDWNEYIKAIASINTEIVLSLELALQHEQSVKDYVRFANSVISDIRHQIMDLKHNV